MPALYAALFALSGVLCLIVSREAQKRLQYPPPLTTGQILIVGLTQVAILTAFTSPLLFFPAPSHKGIRAVLVISFWAGFALAQEVARKRASE